MLVNLGNLSMVGQIQPVQLCFPLYRDVSCGAVVLIAGMSRGTLILQEGLASMPQT